MNRSELQKLARLRVRESRALLGLKHYPGAYYLAGYAIECALKACIAKQIAKHEFPDRKLAQKSHSHNLQELVKVAGLKRKMSNKLRSDIAFRSYWMTVKDWTVDSRYEQATSRSRARDLYKAVTARKHGVLSWVTSMW